MPAGRVAIGLCLSVLAPPAPRPNHRRVAVAVMEDAAARHEGRVFALGSGDLVLLCRAVGDAPSGPLGLPAVLDRLFRLDRPAEGGLVRLWHLGHEADAFSEWCAEQFARPLRPAPARPIPPAPAADPEAELDALLARSRPSDLLSRRHAVLLAPTAARHRPLGPLFREVGFDAEVLDALLPGLAEVQADPCRERLLAARIDSRLLDAVAAELQGGGGTIAGPANGPPLHLALTVQGVLSAAFGRFVQALAGSGRRAAVELSLLEAGEPERFASARNAVRAAGLGLVLGGVTDLAARLLRPEALGADLIKLRWSPRALLGDAAADRELDEAVARIGPERLVLCGVETEGALAWGATRGLRRFHGRYAEVMLAASRLAICAHAGGCTLRQCTQRAYATGPAGRSWCRDHALLDGIAPDDAGRGGAAPSGVGTGLLMAAAA